MGIKCVPDEKQYVNKLNPSDLYEYTLKQIQCYGFEYFCFCFTTHLKNIHVSVKRVSNYSDEFIEFYRSIDVSLNNPLVSHCQRSIDPIIWDESIFRDTPELSRQAQAHGLNYGWSQAVHDTQGWTSILNMARSSTAITQEEFDEKAADVVAVQPIAWSRISRAFTRTKGSDASGAFVAARSRGVEVDSSRQNRFGCRHDFGADDTHREFSYQQCDQKTGHQQ